MRFLAQEIRLGLRRNATMTVAVVVTVAVSLLLLGAGLLVREQIGAMKGYWYDRVQVSVYLCGETSEAQACPQGPVTAEQRERVRGALQAMPVVEQVFYESPQEALGRFRVQFGNSAISRSVTEEAMPESYRVRLRDASRFQEVSRTVRDLPGVELVQDQRALLRRVFSVLSGVQAAAVAVAAAQVVAAALLISNTVRVSAHSRRREAAVMRLVGASKQSVRAPFLVEGALMGLVGAVLAGGVLLAVEKWLVLGRLEPAYRFTAFIGWDALWRTLPVLAGAGVVLTAGASWWSLRRHLRV